MTTADIVEKLIKEIDDTTLFIAVMNCIPAPIEEKPILIAADLGTLKECGFEDFDAFKSYIEDNEDDFFEEFYDQIDLSKVDRDVIIRCLDEWADYDDIALFILDEDIEDYEDFLDAGYEDGDYIYQEEFDDYMQNIIPPLLDFLY